MTRSRPYSLLALMTSLVLVLAACADAQSAASAPASEEAPESEPAAESEAPEPADEEATVNISGFVYRPSLLTVPVGTEVLFVNQDEFAHTVTEGTNGARVEDPFVDAQVGPASEVRITFDEAGTFDLTCRFHPDMNMTIVVEG